MSLLSRDELQSLVENAEPPCVSLYFSTHRAGAETQQDPIRLKNLLREARRQLAEKGSSDSEIETILRPADEILGDTRFWQHQSDGLALFLSPNTFRRHRLPLSFEELVVVNRRFHLTPLLPLLTGDGRFYVLALSQKRVRLFEGNREGLREVDLQAIPESLLDAVGYDFEERSLQFHGASGASQGGGRPNVLYHGQGAGEDDVKEEIAQFLHRIDAGLGKLLADRQAPLVLAAVERNAAMFREVTKLPNVLDPAIEGNPDELSPQVLHERAWAVVEPFFRRQQEEAAARYHDLVGSARATADLEAVVPAAVDGRVAELFVALDAHRWGSFDPGARKVEVRDERRPDDEDLIDRAALESLFHGGTVYAVDRAEVPGEGPLAAVLRW